MTLRVLIFALAAHTASAAERMTLQEFQAQEALADVMLLGTFHFKDAGLDSYKPEVDIDIFSERRQQELEIVVDRIARRFKPTKIAIELRGERAERVVGQEYPAYLDRTFELPANEVYQIGFRLAQRMGHEQLYPVDVMGRSYPDLPDDLEVYARSKQQEALLQGPWDERFFALYRHDDYAKAHQSLVQTLRYMNSPERLMAGHGHYVLGSIAVGADDEYPGADRLTGWWFNRNLRIFGNIRRVTESGDRVLVLIGAGHVPILLHTAQASPEYRVVSVEEVLAD